MTKEEKLIVSAYTGYVMIDFNEIHKFIEKKLERPVWTHEFTNGPVLDELRDILRSDFLKICDNTPLSPELFRAAMARASEEGTEEGHERMDMVMVELLESLGYSEGCKIFRDAEKWYA